MPWILEGVRRPLDLVQVLGYYSDTSDAPCYNFFKGGLINASYNCVDRHLAKYKNKTAIHFVPEMETDKVEHVTYQELYVRVNEFAAILKNELRT